MTTRKTPDLPDKSAYVHTHTLPDGTTYTHSHAHGSKNLHDHESAAGSASKAANAGEKASLADAATGSSRATSGSSGVSGSSASAGAAPVPTVDPDKLIALLTFFVGHNEQHAEELAELIPALPADIQDKMMLAIGTLEAANVDLQGVLDYLIEKKREG